MVGIRQWMLNSRSLLIGVILCELDTCDTAPKLDCLAPAACAVPELQELTGWWEPEGRMREWIDGRESVVVLSTNIWQDRRIP